MAAADALIKMTAQCRGAAPDNGIKHLAMQPCKVRLVLFPESVACCADDVGHLEGGPAHRLIFLLERFTPSGLETSIASSGLATACKWRRDKCKESAVSPILAWPSRTWMVRSSAPASNMSVAKLCRSKCGATRLLMPARLPASFTAFHTTFGVMGTSARQLFTVPGNR